MDRLNLRTAFVLAIVAGSALGSCGLQPDDYFDRCEAVELPPIVCGVGACRVVSAGCQDGEPGACVPLEGTDELCGDGIDNNCDGVIDDGCACEASATQKCFGGRPENRSLGVCRDGVQTCGSGAWGECVGGALPTVKTCDGLDNDCDGEIDSGCPL